MFRVLVISVAVTTALYVFVVLLSVTAYPEGCSGWLDYISRLDEFEGIAGLPAFYAANHYLGQAGVFILMASLLSLVLTSLIGMLDGIAACITHENTSSTLITRRSHLLRSRRR